MAKLKESTKQVYLIIFSGFAGVVDSAKKTVFHITTVPYL
jgi:hypothetical protein